MKTALITGSTSGIGKALVDLFADKGISLVLVDKDTDKLEAQKNALAKNDITVHAIVTDLGETGAAKNLYNKVKKLNITVDILVNNAGFGIYGKYIENDFDRETELAQVNMITLMQLTHLFGKDMANRGGGDIINIASIASFQAGPYMATYYASKAFVRSFSEALHEELKPNGVNVLAICPGPTDTNFEKTAGLEKSYMFKKLKVDSARHVANEIYNAMKKKKAVHVVSGYNRLITFGTRFTSLKRARKSAEIINVGDDKK